MSKFNDPTAHPLQLPVRTLAQRIASGNRACRLAKLIDAEQPLNTRVAMAQRDTSALRRSF